MRTIIVEPEQLDSCAAQMDSCNQEYERCTSELFSEVDLMQTAWQGKDNTAFTGKIMEFQSTMHQLSLLCTQYSEFLKNASRAYVQTQDELAVQAENITA